MDLWVGSPVKKVGSRSLDFAVQLLLDFCWVPLSYVHATILALAVLHALGIVESVVVGDVAKQVCIGTKSYLVNFLTQHVFRWWKGRGYEKDGGMWTFRSGGLRKTHREV